MLCWIWIYNKYVKVMTYLTVSLSVNNSQHELFTQKSAVNSQITHTDECPATVNTGIGQVIIGSNNVRLIIVA